MLAPRRDAFQGLRNQVAGLASRRINAQQQVPSAMIPTQNAQVQSLMMPPELQRIQEMGLSYQLKLQNDSFLQGIRQQQEKLGAAIQQRQQGYVNSVQQFFNTAPPELRQFLNSPQVMQNINVAYANSQPEFVQMQDLNRQYTEYVQTNYGEEQRRLQELQQQAAPQIKQYQNQMQLFNQQQQLRGPQGQTPPIVRNSYDYLPEGLTQEQFMEQVIMNMDQMYRTPEQLREYLKPYYDSYLQEKRMATAQNKTVQSTPLPTQNPYTSTTAVDSTGTPITEIQPAQQQPTVKPIVDPIRTPIFKPPTPLNPIKQEPVKPIVDPKIEPTRPPIGLATQPTIKPIVDPKIEPARPPIGLSTQPTIKPEVDPIIEPVRNRYAPSQYKNLNTNVKGLMR